MPSQPDPEPDVEVVYEIDPRFEWRMRMLLKDGRLSKFEAFLLSANGCDWHDVVRLLDKGATPRQVFDLLLD